MLKNLLSESPHKHILAAGILALICVFSYSNTLNNGFLLDDYTFLVGNYTLKDVSFKTLFTWGFLTNYRPIAFSFLKLELMLLGDYGPGYHVVNIMWFFTVCCLFYWILLKITLNYKAALLAICLFAAHPINNVLVNYKTAVNLSIYVVMMQLTFLLFIYFLTNKNKYLYFLGLFAYFLSLLAHEIAFIMPLFLFLLAYQFKKQGFKHSLILCLPYILPLGLFLLIRLNAVRANTLTGAFQLDISVSQYIASLFKLIFWYNSKIFIPQDILFIWDVNVIGQKLDFLMFFTILVFLTLGTVNLFKKRGNLKFFAFNLYLAGFTPAIFASFSFTQETKNAMIEPHWFIFSSIGFFMVLATLILDTLRVLGKSALQIGITVVITILLVFSTRMSNAVWKDATSYCTYWIEKNPLNGEAHRCRAWAYLREYDRGLIPQNYKNCSDIADIAGAYHLVGEDKISLEYYIMALKMDPKCSGAFYGLGNFYVDNGNDRMAKGAFDTLLSIDPNYPLDKNVLNKLYDY